MQLGARVDVRVRDCIGFEFLSVIKLFVVIGLSFDTF